MLPCGRITIGRHILTPVLIIQSSLYPLQVAFGDDFESMHKHTQLKYAKGNGSLLFLLTHALEGYGRATMEPLLPVSLSVCIMQL